MKRLVAAVLLAVVVATFSAGPASAALGVVVAVSPAEGIVGRPIEVLLRTFVPIGEGEADLPVSTLAYPSASGLWSLLYPVADYPFDVVAQAEDGTAMPISLVRDTGDATLWRGLFTPTTSGVWSISVRNFSAAEPGASARVSVVAGDTVPVNTLIGLAGLMAGVLVGLFLGRRGQRRTGA